MYEPFEGKKEIIEPVMVAIDKDVWEMVKSIRATPAAAAKPSMPCGRRISAHRSMGASRCMLRIVRLRSAHTSTISCASAQSCAPTKGLRMMRQYPTRYCSGCDRMPRTESWFRSGGCSMPSVASLPDWAGILRSATINLVQAGLILYGDDPNGKAWGGRRPKLYQLCVEDKS